MGLDSYFGKNTLDAEGKHYWLDFEELGIVGPKVRLCGGMFSGNGSDGSFRGKVYADIVEKISGESLYDDNINIAKVAEDLRFYCDQHKKTRGDKIVNADWDIRLSEVRDLATLFEFARDNHLDYHAWY